MDKKVIYQAIEKSSDEIIAGENELYKRIRSAKNYVANQDLTRWAFSKLVATEKFDVYYGSEAKRFFYDFDFINILSLKNKAFKEEVIQKFLDWSDKVDYINLRQKFKTDQDGSKRFELLIQKDQIPKEIIKNEDFSESNIEGFIEGFKRHVLVENSYRDSSLVKLAREKLGLNCWVCGFSFEKFYGDHGKGFIEIHHLYPIREGKRKSTLEDVVPVCSNCHRMLHKGVATLSIEDLKRMILEAKDVRKKHLT